MGKETAKTSKEVKSSNKYVGMLLDNLNNLKGYLLKPLESVKAKETEDIKSVAITGGFLVVLMTLVNLIMTMINSVITYDWTGKFDGFDFGNLGDLNYLSLIFKNLLIYAVVMLAIAGVFYIGALIVKKEVNYAKLLTIVFIAAIPLTIGNTVVATILGYIYNPLAVIASVATSIYSITIFAKLVNDEVKLSDMTLIYYNAACYSVIILVVYFIVVRMITSAVTGIFGGF